MNSVTILNSEPEKARWDVGVELEVESSPGSVSFWIQGGAYEDVDRRDKRDSLEFIVRSKDDAAEIILALEAAFE